MRDRLGDDRLRGRGEGGKAQGWPAAHFLRYSGCKFHMRIPFSLLASSSHIHIYAQSDGVTAAGWLVPMKVSFPRIPKFKHLSLGTEGKRESSERGLPLQTESVSDNIVFNGRTLYVKIRKAE